MEDWPLKATTRRLVVGKADLRHVLLKDSHQKLAIEGFIYIEGWSLKDFHETMGILCKNLSENTFLAFYFEIESTSLHLAHLPNLAGQDDRPDHLGKDDLAI